jgi:hypothetical protein
VIAQYSIWKWKDPARHELYAVITVGVAYLVATPFTGRLIGFNKECMDGCRIESTIDWLRKMEEVK